MTTETLQTLTLPGPPMLEAALGYPGTARYVAFYWIPAGDELMWDEGWRRTVGAWQGWLVFTRHPKVAPALAPYAFGDSDTPATHWFLLDRETCTCAVGTARAVQRALHTGNPAPAAPPWLQPTPGEPLLTLTEAAWQAMVAGWQAAQVPITPEEAYQRLTAHARLVDALTAWLDAQAG